MVDFLGLLLVPSGVLTALLVVSAMLLISKSTRHFVRWTALAALLTYTVFGSGWVAHALLRPLEYAYPAVTDPRQIESADVIVVLTGHASAVDSVSPVSWVNISSAYRILEALWLQNRLRDTPIVISGNTGSSQAMRRLMIELGASPEQVFVDQDAQDTSASASNLTRSIAQGERCLLVTSAGHMPRSLLSFEAKGLNCLPVPTELYTPFQLGTWDFLPTPEKLILSDLAVHEYLGIAWYWLSGRL